MSSWLCLDPGSRGCFSWPMSPPTLPPAAKRLHRTKLTDPCATLSQTLSVACVHTCCFPVSYNSHVKLGRKHFKASWASALVISVAFLYELTSLLKKDWEVIKASPTKQHFSGYIKSEGSMYHSSLCVHPTLFCPAITKCWTLGNLHRK